MTGTVELIDWRKLTREQQCLLYTICQLEQLKAAGLMSGGHVASTAKTRAAFQEMIAEGWAPAAEETQAAVREIEAHYVRKHGTPA